MDPQEPVSTAAQPEQPEVALLPRSSRFLFFKKRILVFVVIIIMVLLLIILISARPKHPSTPAPEQSQIQTVTPTVVVWKSYQTPYYTVSYPGDWKISIVSNINGQQIVTLGPNLDKGIQDPAVFVDARVASSDASLQLANENLTRIFSFAKIASQSNFSTVIQGTVPFREGYGTIEQGKTQKTIASLYTQGRTYQMTLVYSGEKNAVYEATYSQVLQKFVITP